MKNKLYSVETKIKIEFYDVDSMKIVYHGNYVKFLEVGRCALLDKIGYNYNEMEKDGYSFPITKLNVKYIRSLVFGETAIVKTSVVEYENMLKLQYERCKINYKKDQFARTGLFLSEFFRLKLRI